ncbi:MAG: magnesium/cobalt transporter CorA [Deltaproteobacteria bacterium]|nr:magnesium/cobalt transporter CorA [Deltaproteobacteria bacterium]
MFRVLDVAASGSAILTEDAGKVAPPPEETIRWIDLDQQDEAQLALLRDRFGFHPLAIEDCAHFDQRPKLEEYGEYLFLVIHGFTRNGKTATQLKPIEVHAFMGPRFLVTVHESPCEALDAAWKRVARDPALARKGTDFLYYILADAIVDANFPILDDINDLLEDIEDAVLGRAERRELPELFEIKRTLSTMRRFLSPQREVFAMLAKRGDPRVSERTALYFRDVYDHLVRISESIDAGREILGNALDAYLTMVSNRTNEVMKRLAIMSAIFLPLTFVTGFFGQNFTHLPFDSDLLMWTAIFLCLLVPGAMLFWFQKSEWL